MACLHGQRKVVKAVRTFFKKERWGSIFVWASFMDTPLRYKPDGIFFSLCVPLIYAADFK